MKKITPALFLAVALLLNGCASATKDFSKRLRGTWKVANYGVERPDTRSVAGAPPDYGTITFNKNGTGSADNPSIFGNITSRSGSNNFKWSNTDNIVVIRGDDAAYSKSWIVVTNKENQQVWKSTDGTNAVNTIELRR